MVKRVAKNLDGQGVPAAAYHKPFPIRDPWGGVTEYGKQVSDEIREKLKSFVGRKPGKEWAYRINEKHLRGEHVSNYALDCAKQAIGSDWKPRSVRQPGEDDV